MVTRDSLIARLNAADPRALPRLATLVENDDPLGLDVLDALYGRTGQAQVLGITGPPGCGKSTLIASLLQPLRDAGRRVAVIAVDPSSSLTGGAVLGDRIRMMERHDDPGVFVRSMASRGRQGGLAWSTANLVHLFDAAGYSVIIVETVGSGQDGTDIAFLADTVVVVEAPGLGDGIQAIKSGLLECADILVVNKSDQPGAQEALRTLRAAFGLGQAPGQRRVPILATAASTAAGSGELHAAIDAHATWLRESGEINRRRELRARAEVLAGLRSTLERRLDADAANSSRLAEIIARVVRRDQSPRLAIADALRVPLVADGPPQSADPIGDQGGS